MKLLLCFVFLLTSYFSFSQCNNGDTAQANYVYAITATTATVTASESSSGAGTQLSSYLTYVRGGHTDSVTAPGSFVNLTRYLTGLQAGTQYYYYYSTVCTSGTVRQHGPYYFTTLGSTVAYVPERPTVFIYAKIDSLLSMTGGDTTLGRASSSLPAIKYKSSNNTFYGYYPNCTCWRPLAIDSSGIIGLLDGKVDSVTVSGDSLFYWKVGVSYGYILPNVTMEDILTNEDATPTVSQTHWLDFNNNQVTFGNTGGSGGRAAELEWGADGTISLQASRFGSIGTQIYVYADSAKFRFHNGVANIDPIVGKGLRSTTDTSAYKPMVWNPTSGEWKRLTYWGYANPGIPTLQQVTTAGNTSTNDIILDATAGSTAGFYNDAGTPIAQVSMPQGSLSMNLLGFAFQQLTPSTKVQYLFRRNTIVNNTTIYLPDSSGTIALLQNIPTSVTSVSGTTNRITSTGGTTPVVDISASYVGQNSITTLGTIGTGTWNATAIGETKGGTNQTSYTQGDILYASASNTLSKLAKNASATRYLSNTGTSNNPAWAQVNVANGVTGTLPLANGGTGTTDGTGLPYIALSATSTLVNPILDVAGSTFTLINGVDNILSYDAGNTVTQIGNTQVFGKFNETNKHLYLYSQEIAAASIGDALTVTDPATGEIGVAPNLAFQLRKQGTEIYAKNGLIFAKDRAGNSTQISPHNSKGEWIYNSTDFKGVTTEVNMTTALKTIEDLTKRVYELEKKLKVKSKVPVKLIKTKK